MSEKDMTPAEMLDAAMDGTLTLDGEAKPTEPEVQPDTPEATDDQQHDEPEGAPIASKSGTYTIPYEKLVQAREKASTLESENAALKAQLDELNAKQQQNLEQAQASAQDRADAGQQATDADQNLQAAQAAIEQGVDVDIFGDFSEEAIAKGVATLQARAMESIKAELRAELEKELAPIKQSRAQQVVNTHYAAIYAKHPDADELIQSAEFADWQKGLPTFVSEGVAKALSEGTTEQVIEVFDTFKADTGKPVTQTQAQAKVPEVQRRVPNSLSEIAGEPHRDLVQQTLETADSPASLMEAMQSMTPEQLERVLNSV